MNLYANSEKHTLEKPLAVLLVQGQQVTRSRPNLGEHVLDPPHFPLVFKTIFTDEFKLLVKTFLRTTLRSTSESAYLLEGTLGLPESLTVVSVTSHHFEKYTNAATGGDKIVPTLMRA